MRFYQAFIFFIVLWMDITCPVEAANKTNIELTAAFALIGITLFGSWAILKIGAIGDE